MTESTAVATTNPVGNLMAFAGGTNPFLQHAKSEGVSDGLYMRHNGNTGKFIIGDEEIEGGTFYFDVMGARLAWLGFDPNNKPVNGPEVKMLDGVALQDPPKVPGVKWIKQIKLTITDPESGKDIVLSCKAEKPNRAIWKLIKAYGETVGRHPDGTGFQVPLVQAGSRSFEMDIKEKQDDGTERTMRVKKYSETFEIVDWGTADLIAEVKASAGDHSEEAAPPMKDVTPQVEVLPPQETKTFPNAAGAATGRGRFGSR